VEQENNKTRDLSSKEEINGTTQRLIKEIWDRSELLLKQFLKD